MKPGSVFSLGPWVGIPFFLMLYFIDVPEAFSQKTIADELKKLNSVLAKSDQFDEQKMIRLDSLASSKVSANDSSLFGYYHTVFVEYEKFRADSALAYSIKMSQIAARLQDQQKLAFSRLKSSFVLISSGMLYQGLDSLQEIEPSQQAIDDRAEYFALMSRCYYELAENTQDKATRPKYVEKGKQYLDSTIRYLGTTTDGFYYRGLNALRQGKLDSAFTLLHPLLARPDLSKGDVAIVASTLSDIHIRRNQNEEAIRLLVRAAIADLETSTKETSATYHLANLLFREGDLNNSAKLIQKAADDANFYGSSARKTQLNVLLPLINQERVRAMEDEKSKLVTYAVFVTLLFISLGVMTTIIFRQIKKTKAQERLIVEKNTALEHLLSEKEWLLKEIHHRVKNNLQTVISLLESQSFYLENEALSAIQNSKNRVYTMSLIHQKLYQSDVLGRIDMSVYIPELIQYLKDSFEIKQGIRFHLEIEEILLDISQAIPLGLILNEAVTNSIKYAFGTAVTKEIKITFGYEGTETIALVIEDNGMGFSPEFQAERRDSLGLKLMRGLSLDIGGDLVIDSVSGTKVKVIFRETVAADEAVSIS